METPDLAQMRAEYAREGLDETAAGDDPLVLFGRWLNEAIDADLYEPNAMALATATRDGRPAVRIVLLKGLDERGLTFFTSYESRKGAEMEANPRAAATMRFTSSTLVTSAFTAIARMPPAVSSTTSASAATALS